MMAHAARSSTQNRARRHPARSPAHGPRGGTARRRRTSPRPAARPRAAERGEQRRPARSEQPHALLVDWSNRRVPRSSSASMLTNSLGAGRLAHDGGEPEQNEAHDQPDVAGAWTPDGRSATAATRSVTIMVRRRGNRSTKTPARVRPGSAGRTARSRARLGVTPGDLHPDGQREEHRVVTERESVVRSATAGRAIAKERASAPPPPDIVIAAGASVS